MSGSQCPAIPATVLVLDDDVPMRRTLETLLHEAGHAVRGFSASQDVLDADLPEGLRCLLAEMRLPQMNALDLHGRLLAEHRALPIICMTREADVPSSVAAMKAGAVDYLPKPLAPGDLLTAVGRALERDRERLHDQPLLDRFIRLTPRERQVMGGVVRGLMNKQIAWELRISEITVKLHRCSLMRKMAARSVVDLVHAAQTLDRHASA